MKKILMTMLLAGGVLAAMAQTDFRHLSYKEALEAAKAEKKLVFLDFYTSWCGPCKMMLKDVFPQKQVGGFLNGQFVCIKIDAEKGEGVELAKRYQVKAYPTFVGIDANEKEVMRKVGGADAGSFIAEIKRQLDPEKTPERMKARYEGGERTPDLIEAYAQLKMSEARAGRGIDEAKKKEVFDMVAAYFNGLGEKERLAPENLFIYTTYVESPLNPIARYMVENHDRFDASVKEAVAKKISDLYLMQVADYLTCAVPYDADNYRKVKADIETLGLNKDGVYNIPFRFIECHAKGDLNAYLDLCEQQYGQLGQWQSTLLLKFDTVIGAADEQVKKRAIKFVRSRLPEMSTNNLFFVPYMLQKLEGGGH